MFEYFYRHPEQIWEWLFLIATLGFSIYAMIKIKNEKNHYLETASEKNFKQFILKVPSWWTLVEEKEDQLTYKRTDTNYDWKTVILKTNSILDPVDQLQSYFEREEILPDEDWSNHYSSELSQTFLKLNEKREKQQLDFLRFEGTCTEKIENRIYLDILIVRDPKNNNSIHFISKSSILNGCVEGPYFEELLLRLQFKT